MTRVHAYNRSTAQVPPTPSFEVADAAALAVEPVDLRDIGAVARQLDDDSLYILVDTIPPVVGPPAVPRLGVWQALSKAGATSTIESTAPAQTLPLPLGQHVAFLEGTDDFILELPDAPYDGYEVKLVNILAAGISVTVSPPAGGGSIVPAGGSLLTGERMHLIYRASDDIWYQFVPTVT